MKISLIAAMAHHRVIGKNNQLPWHLPADLQHFKAMTTGKPIIMGRKTYEAIGRPLPNRQNIVLTHNADWRAQDVIVVHSWEAALQACHDAPEVMVIGGQALYELALSKASQLYLSFIDAEIAGDAFFPAWDPKDWEEVGRQTHEVDEKNDYTIEFVMLQRTTFFQ